MEEFELFHKPGRGSIGPDRITDRKRYFRQAAGGKHEINLINSFNVRALNFQLPKVSVPCTNSTLSDIRTQ